MHATAFRRLSRLLLPLLALCSLASAMAGANGDSTATQQPPRVRVRVAGIATAAHRRLLQDAAATKPSPHSIEQDANGQDDLDALLNGPMAADYDASGRFRLGFEWALVRRALLPIESPPVAEDAGSDSNDSNSMIRADFRSPLAFRRCPLAGNNEDDDAYWRALVVLQQLIMRLVRFHSLFYLCFYYQLDSCRFNTGCSSPVNV